MLGIIYSVRTESRFNLDSGGLDHAGMDENKFNRMLLGTVHEDRVYLCSLINGIIKNKRTDLWTPCFRYSFSWSFVHEIQEKEEDGGAADS
ncbi:unnamed protein product [Victoria cruziana]